MGVTIKVNGEHNSLAHKGSNGFAKSTAPDVCKTPSPGGPVPVPYPILFSFSADLKNGTKTVKADGGNMIAVKGSEFSRCSGDEPGTAGGVVSNTNMKEAKWILYSFDVKMDGKNACRMSDKMTMNHGNTVCLQGEMQIPVLAGVTKKDLEKLAEECNRNVNCHYGPCPKRSPRGHECTTLGTQKHKCCEEAIKKYNEKNPGSNLRSEVGYGSPGNPLPPGAAAEARAAASQAYDVAISGYLSSGRTLAQARAYARRAMVYMKELRKHGAKFIADVLVGDPPTAAYDFKFNCKDKKDIKIPRPQIDRYKEFTGLKPKVIAADGRKCPKEC
jgi:hypothetical protein